ncbi:MAG TPA: anti-sigma factor [Bryobacteraceae bacterium]|nr:anti-sigma factor [Bryobacteraceae bacterium]
MKHDDCAHIFELLSEYLDHELEPASCEQLENHLQDCPECVEFVQSLKRSRELCRQFGGSRQAAQLAPEAMAALRGAYQKMMARRAASR